MDKNKCLCYLQVENSQIINRGKWGGQATGFSVSSDYSFCNRECIHATGSYTFNFPDSNTFTFKNTDDWTISFYVLKTKNSHNILVFGSEFYTIQTADFFSTEYVGARLAYNYTHNLETPYSLNEKHHVAFVHESASNTFTLYLDGKPKASYARILNFPITRILNPERASDWTYLDELIITPQALWTEEFTPKYRYLWDDTKKIYLTDNTAYAMI